MATQGGSMNKHNQHQSSKNEQYYKAQYFRTEKNKKRKAAKEARKQARAAKRLKEEENGQV